MRTGWRTSTICATPCSFNRGKNPVKDSSQSGHVELELRSSYTGRPMIRQVKIPLKNNRAMRIIRTRQAYLGNGGLLIHLKAH